MWFLFGSRVIVWVTVLCSKTLVQNMWHTWSGRRESEEARSGIDALTKFQEEESSPSLHLERKQKLRGCRFRPHLRKNFLKLSGGGTGHFIRWGIFSPGKIWTILTGECLSGFQVPWHPLGMCFCDSWCLRQHHPTQLSAQATGAHGAREMLLGWQRTASFKFIFYVSTAIYIQYYSVLITDVELSG